MPGCSYKDIQERDYFASDETISLTATGPIGSTCAAFATRSEASHERHRSPRRIQ
jgi:hypothetical protein